MEGRTGGGRMRGNMKSNNMRELGKSGIFVYPMGMGCWSYGGGKYWGDQAQNDVNEIVAAALDQGVNFFDTAEMYNDGRSEESLGLALLGKRSQAVIATKIGPNNCYPDTLVAHLDASLKRLQTDYVDIYMLHWPINRLALEHFTNDPAVLNSPPSVIETFETLTKLQKQGKIRSIGVSNFGRAQLQEALAAGARIDINEMAYNVVSRAIEKDIAPFCLKNNISIVASMALQQGLLAGLFNRVEDIPHAQAHSRHFKQERGGEESRHYEEGAEVEIFATLDGLKLIAQEQGIHIAQLCIAWLLAKPFIAAMLVGSRNVKELATNIKAVETVIPAEVVARIDALSKPVLDKLGYNADYYENSRFSRIF
jgi:aryl-alcohol dehydrogenase-like predicted oxidoreductase